MSDIPEARRLLAEALPHIPPPWREQVAEALDLMYRRPPARPRARKKNLSVDARLAASIRLYVASHPNAHIQDVAVLFDTNIGRVSEALHGER